MTQRGSLWRGLLLGALIDIALLAASILGIAIGGIGINLLMGYGVVQAGVLVVFYLKFRKRGATETAKGVLVIAGLAFLAWSACLGALFTGALRIGG